jgi:hypothetical protein
LFVAVSVILEGLEQEEEEEEKEEEGDAIVCNVRSTDYSSTDCRANGEPYASVNTDYMYSVPYKFIVMLFMLADPELPSMTECTSHEGAVVPAFQPSAASEDG